MKKTIVNSFLLFSFILIPIFAMAQSNVTGKVTDAGSGEPLLGVTIVNKGTSKGTTTDVNGNYSISVEEGSTLVVSYLGYQTKEINVTGSTLNIEMEVDAMQLKTVVVSANRVNEDLQKTPVAATVLSGVDLRNRSVNNTLEGVSSTPGLIYDAYTPSQVTLSIRGIATNLDNVGVEQGIGMYINDVYQSRPFGFNATLMDVDRVEVLRGPQGTLFGKNTVGGVIHIITEKPKMTNNGSVEISAGNLNYFQARGKWNTVLAEDKLAMRVSGAVSKREAGFMDHAPSDNRMDFIGLKGSLLYQVSNNVEAIVDVDFSKDASAEAQGIYLGFDPDNLVERPEDRLSNAEQPFDWNRDQFSSALRIKADIGNDNTLNIISSYGKSEDEVLQESDFLEGYIVNFSRFQKFQTFTQEIRVNSSRDRNFSYVAGLFYANEKINGTDGADFGPILIPAIAPLLGLPDGFYIDGYEEFTDTDAFTKGNSFSVFGSGTLKLGDRAKLTLGLRYINENKKLTFNQSHVPSQASIDVLGVSVVSIFYPDFATEISQNDGALSGNLNFEYSITDDVLGYFSFARGYKGAGFNYNENAFPSDETVAFGPETVNNFELGLKSKISNRVRLNLAGYIMKYFDKQEVVIENVSAKIANAPESNGWGIEAELSAIIAKGFQIDLSGAILDMEYDDFPFADDSESGLPANLKGYKLSKVPENTWTISPQYKTDFGKNNSTSLLARLDINHTGHSFNDILNTPIIEREPVTLLNARLGLSFNNGKYNLAFWGKNLSDEVYLAHGINLVFGANAQLNLRRSMGVDFRINF